MRKRLIISLFLMIALLSVYAALPRLAEQAISAALAPYGVEIDQFDLEHPGWSRVLIRELQLRQNTPDYHLQLNSKDVEARFSLLQLLRQSEIEQFVIGSADIQLTLHPQPDGHSEPLLAPLPSQILAQLPVAEMVVQQYSVNADITQLQLPGLPAQVRIDGRIGVTPEQLTAYLSTATGLRDSTLALALQASHRDQIHALLTLDSESLLDSDLQLTLAENSLSISSNNQLDLSRWLQLRQHPLFAGVLEQSGIPQQLPALSGRLTVAGDSVLTVNPGQPLTGEHHYQLSSQIDLADPRQLIPNSPVTAAQSTLEFNADLQITPAYRTRLTFTQLQASLQDLSYRDESLQFTSAELNLSSATPLTVDIAADQPGQIRIADTELLLQGAAIPFSVQRATEQPLRGELRYQPLVMQLSAIDLTSLSANINLPEIALTAHLEALKLPRLELSSKISLQPQQIRQQFTLTLLDSDFADGQLSLSGRSQTDLQTRISTGYWQAAPLSLSRIDKLARRYIPGLPPELLISGGQLQHQGWFDYRPAGLALRLLNNATDLDLSYDQTRLFDARWQSDTRLRHSGQLADSGQLQVGFIDLGLPLENLTGGYRYSRSAAGQQQLDINSSTVSLLGGEMTTLPVSFDPARPDIDTAVALTHIDLAALIALEQQQGLSGSGTLNGQMPVRLVDNQLTVTRGQILSTPEGGWIRFDPPPEFRVMARANPALNIAFDALENLQYDSLGIEVDYRVDGTALLKTHLKGQNPDWNSGQPVDLTINIEENLPKLIQALQFTDKLTETIEKRYR